MAGMVMQYLHIDQQIDKKNTNHKAKAHAAGKLKLWQGFGSRESGDCIESRQ